MIKNYLKVAFRNLVKNKLYSFLNISGLAIGIASCLLIIFYVLDELSYDQFHQEAHSVYRINTYWGNDPQSSIYATTPPPLYSIIKQEVPEVEAVARAFKWNDSTMRLPKDDEEGEDEVVFRETEIFIVDPEFLQVLDFNIILGDATTAFQEQASIVLTKETALRYFGEEALQSGEVIGKTILFGGNQTPRYVTAVVDPPENTHFHFDMLVNINFGYREIGDMNNWVWNVMHTYVKLNEEAHNDPEKLKEVQKKFSQIAENYGKPFMLQESRTPDNVIFDYKLQPVTDIHLHSHFLQEHEPNSSIMVVYILSAIALFIVLLACINFMNLSTAQSTKRAKEVGVRKVLGSHKSHLIGQFLSESMIYSLLAFLLALGLVEAFRMPFNTITGKHLTFDWMHQPWLISMIGIGIVGVGLLAGSYPAFYLSSFQPLTVLKGKFTNDKGKALNLRNGLVVFQFVISIGLIICTFLVFQQLQFMQNKNLGYERENILVIKNDREVQDKWQEFTQALQQQPGVAHASFTTGIPFQPMRDMRDFRVEGAATGMGINWFLIDENYIPTLGLEVVEGRNFQENMASNREGLLLNEAAVKVLGLENPVGKIIIKNAGADDEERLQVLGVVKDFNTESFHNSIKPLAFQYFRSDFVSDFVAVRLQKGKVMDAVQQVENTWKQFEPENPFVYSFLDQDFDALFRSELRLGKVLGIFTSLAVFIACLGLFGLAAFMTEQRTKEIGIRKVLGASVGNIVTLFSKDFVKLVLIGFFLAIPLAYIAMQQWLENFAYRIEIEIWTFIIAGVTALLIAWLTVGYQSLKAALRNPVDSLRNE